MRGKFFHPQNRFYISTLLPALIYPHFNSYQRRYYYNCEIKI